MNEKEQYKENLQAQIDTWKTDIANLKAKVSAAQTDAQIAMDKQVIVLERRLEDAHAKLIKANEDELDTRKKVVESDWDSLKSAVSDATSMSKDLNRGGGGVSGQ